LNLLTDDDSAQAREWSNCQACADVHSPAKAGYPPKRYALAVQSSWITLDALPTTSTPPGGCTHQHRLPATSFRRIYILERTLRSANKRHLLQIFLDLVDGNEGIGAGIGVGIGAAVVVGGDVFINAGIGNSYPYARYL